MSGLASLAWSPDGRRLATGGFDRAVKIWDMSDVKNPVELITLHGHEWIVFALAWHPSGRMLLSRDSVSGAWIWDASDGYAAFRPQSKHTRTEVQ